MLRICVLITGVAFVIAAAANDNCTFSKDAHNCTVDKGHAICAPTNLHKNVNSIERIPTCANWITIVLISTTVTSIKWKLVFGALQQKPHLEKLSITVDHVHHINGWMATENLQRDFNFPNLTVLQINARFHLDDKRSEWRTSLGALKVLDLSRTYHIGMDKAQVRFLASTLYLCAHKIIVSGL